MTLQPEWRFPATNPTDFKWGIVAYSFGSQSIGPGDEYPPRTSFASYIFHPDKGRVIDEYQLVYITKGSGFFTSESLEGRSVKIKAGDGFLLFPGEWHTYKPDLETGWDEYWIHFVGNIADMWTREGLLDKSDPVLHIGIKEEILNLYRSGERIMKKQAAGYQQAMCGICANIICSAVYYHRNNLPENSRISEVVDHVRVSIGTHLQDIKAPDVAEDLDFSYSKFRKEFKNYTGMPPGAYIRNIRISQAKELLTNTDMSIKEIAFECGFGNADYFCVAFRKNVGMSATEYRKRTRYNLWE